jgi:hypothetical protein
LRKSPKGAKTRWVATRDLHGWANVRLYVPARVPIAADINPSDQFTQASLASSRLGKRRGSKDSPTLIDFTLPYGTLSE